MQGELTSRSGNRSGVILQTLVLGPFSLSEKTYNENPAYTGNRPEYLAYQCPMDPVFMPRSELNVFLAEPYVSDDVEPLLCLIEFLHRADIPLGWFMAPEDANFENLKEWRIL